MPSSHETILQAGMEEIEPGRHLVSVFDMPGCYSSGSSEEEALAKAPEQARWYYRWLASKDGGFPEIDGALRVEMVERVPLRGFFEKDAQAIWPWDMDLALRVLAWNREDLLSFIQKQQALEADSDAQAALVKLVEHIYRSELWLLSRLRINTEDMDLPASLTERLTTIRQRVTELLPDWVNAESIVITENEKWSPRKVLRRLLWHDRDHIPQTQPVK